MKFTNNKNSIKGLWIYVVLFILIGIVGFLFLSPTFERNAPKITVEEQIYWNFQKPIKINISDDEDIKSYEILFVDGEKQVRLDTKVLKNENGSLDLEIVPPVFDEFYKPTNGVLQIHVFDTSKWNFFRGNEATKKSNIIIDKRSPIANVVTNSYLLRQGGSGVIVVEIADENLKDYYITLMMKRYLNYFLFIKKDTIFQL